VVTSPHGVELQWRDRARKDLKHFSESDWYVVAQDRISGVSCVCLPLHCWNQYSHCCFVAIVTDLFGDLRIWLDTDVIASDQDEQQ